jgi:hypothetical protein
VLIVAALKVTNSATALHSNTVMRNSPLSSADNYPRLIIARESRCFPKLTASSGGVLAFLIGEDFSECQRTNLRRNDCRIAVAPRLTYQEEVLGVGSDQTEGSYHDHHEHCHDDGIFCDIISRLFS